MKSLKDHWALVLLVAVLAFLYPVWRPWTVPVPAYSYHWQSGMYFRCNVATGIREFAGPDGWKRESR